MWMISEEERAYYEDLSFLASKKELEDFSTTPLSERDQYVERFWRRHDPTLVTGGDIRRLEHYRRVWFARTYFSSPGKAWGRRGDVFIRYGEPAYRSRSNQQNALPPAAVVSDKEKMAANMYTRGHPSTTDYQTKLAYLSPNTTSLERTTRTPAAVLTPCIGSGISMGIPIHPVGTTRNMRSMAPGLTRFGHWLRTGST